MHAVVAVLAAPRQRLDRARGQLIVIARRRDGDLLVERRLVDFEPLAISGCAAATARERLQHLPQVAEDLVQNHAARPECE